MEPATDGLEKGRRRAVLGTLTIVLMMSAYTAGIWFYMRRKYIVFSQNVIQSIDQILAGDGTDHFHISEESLQSKIEAKLKRLQEITRAAAVTQKKQKEEIQGIVSDISHQLKTPVSNIRMYSDMAVNPEISEEMQEECLHVLHSQVEKLDFLVRELINMSRLEQNLIVMHPDVIQLRDVVREAVSTVIMKAEKKEIALDWECPDHFESVLDERWTVEAISNVLDNAVKYTSAGGRIRVYAEELGIYLKVAVEDNGMGISAEHINDVCKRFFREKKAAQKEGVGIGLYLTREIMRQQKGYLKIYSCEEKGTKVAFYFLKKI